VGRQPESQQDGLAAMVITTDAAVPRAVLDEIVAGEGFVAARTVSL
jgi:hypothetical protein